MPRTNLHRRGQTILLRRIIPHDLRPRFGQREILRSLGHATPGQARRMAQRLWERTGTLFTLVRFNRSLSPADIERLAERYLESESLRHDGLIATIGHYPEPEDLPAADTVFGHAPVYGGDPAELAVIGGPPDSRHSI